MRNIPLFTTEYGVASLILETVPSRGEAFIQVQSSLEPAKLLEECRQFCVACGAEKIYAAGHDFLRQYPVYMSIREMQARRDAIGETDAVIVPVWEETAEDWRRIYNEKMACVSKAAWMTEFEMKRLIREGGAYFVRREGELLGIGVVSGNELRAVASVQPGQGAEVVRALCRAVTEDAVKIQVASDNARAVALYERLGFTPVREVNQWYKII